MAAAACPAATESAPQSTVISWIAPAIQRYLTGAPPPMQRRRRRPPIQRQPPATGLPDLLVRIADNLTGDAISPVALPLTAITVLHATSLEVSIASASDFGPLRTSQEDRPASRRVAAPPRDDGGVRVQLTAERAASNQVNGFRNRAHAHPPTDRLDPATPATYVETRSRTARISGLVW
jgi:hypothetical protein